MERRPNTASQQTKQALAAALKELTVSYTHLTLPTT